MCKTRWNEYTAGLARDAKARKAATAGSEPTADPEAADAGDPPKRRKANAPAQPEDVEPQPTA